MVSAGRPGSVPLGEDEAPGSADGCRAGRPGTGWRDGAPGTGRTAGEAGSGSRSAAGVTVRPMGPSELAPAARLHLRVLDAEFIARLGAGFLQSYYRAWVDADGALALVALSPSGRLDGVLLGALDPVVHSSSMVRRHWPSLASRLLLAAVRDPRLGRDLVCTRAVRYSRGLARAVVRPGPGRTTDGDRHPGAGEITHLMVAPEAQGAGIGRLLVEAAEEVGRRAGLGELVLVTPVEEWGARSFYERVGWVLDRPVSSASGERFVRYRRPLGGG